MTTVLRRSVRGCKVHQQLMDEALQRLHTYNAFRFEDLLDALQLQLMSGSIRWDYLREFIVEDTREDLVPVAETYFRRHSIKEEIANPGKFVAGAGGSKETAGYVWFSERTEHLVRHYFSARYHQIKGAHEKYSLGRAKMIEKFGESAAPPQLELSIETEAPA